MTFCTACASPVGANSNACPLCGAPLSSAAISALDRPSPHGTGARSVLVRLLYLTPVILLFMIVGAFVQRQNAEQEWLASAYAAADSAAVAGDLVAARDGFSAIAGYRDAAVRAKEMDTRLQPLEAAYTDGVRAIDRGNYANAVALLEPVAQEAPALEDVVVRLDDARRLLGGSLHRDVEAAETVRDWSSAEHIWRQLVALTPHDPEPRQQLASLQREHGPLVLGKDRVLWLVAPDGSEPKQLTDALHVIWPVWSPDRSRIAFLAPDPDDPMGNVSLYTVGVDGKSPQRLADSVSAHAPPSWSPDGKQIAYTSFAGYDPIYESGAIGVRIVDVSTGKETDLTGTDFPLAFNPSWSPDGTRIAFVVKHQGLGERPQHSPGDVMMTELGKKGFTNLTNGKVSDVWSVSWSPRDDTLLLFSLFGQTWYEPPSTAIRVLDLSSGQIDDLADVDEQPTMPVWSPDGMRLAFTANENQVIIGDIGGERQTLETPKALSGELTWSPDGRALLVNPWNADDASTLVDLSHGKPVLSDVRLEFDSSPPFISPPQWSPMVALPPENNPSLPLSDPAATPVAS